MCSSLHQRIPFPDNPPVWVEGALPLSRRSALTGRDTFKTRDMGGTQGVVHSVHYTLGWDILALTGRRGLKTIDLEHLSVFDRGRRGLKTIDLERLSVFDRGRRGIKTIDLEHLSVFDRGRHGHKTIDLE